MKTKQFELSNPSLEVLCIDEMYIVSGGGFGDFLHSVVNHTKKTVGERIVNWAGDEANYLIDKTSFGSSPAGRIARAVRAEYRRSR